MLVPGLDWGWWSAIGGEGNPVFGSTDQTSGTVWEWIIPLVFMCDAAAGAAAVRERRGAHVPPRRRDLVDGRRVLKTLQFGLVHALIGIPIGAAFALSIGGAYFLRVYLRAYARSGSTSDATMESTTAHTVYNGVIIGVVLIALFLTAVLP